MKRIQHRILMRRLLKKDNFESRDLINKRPELDADFKEWKKLKSVLSESEFTFREGFADRTTTRLVNLLSNEPIREFYASLSSLLPKMLYSYVAALAIVIVILFALNGELNVETAIAPQQVDDSNFVTYLILENNPE